LEGGLPAWRRARGDVATTRVAGPSNVDTPGVVDGRQASGYSAGHLPRARLLELGDLGSGAGAPAGPDPPPRMRAPPSGRGATAGLLERAGRSDISILVGGPADWALVTGTELTVGR